MPNTAHYTHTYVEYIQSVTESDPNPPPLELKTLSAFDGVMNTHSIADAKHSSRYTHVCRVHTVGNFDKALMVL